MIGKRKTAPSDECRFERGALLLEGCRSSETGSSDSIKERQEEVHAYLIDFRKHELQNHGYHRDEDDLSHMIRRGICSCGSTCRRPLFVAFPPGRRTQKRPADKREVISNVLLLYICYTLNQERCQEASLQGSKIYCIT